MLAGVANNWQWLVNTTKRSGNETRSFYDDNNIGDARNSTDPQSSDANSVLGKLIYQASPAHRFELIAEQFKQSSQTELLSEVSTVVRGTTTLESFGDDEQERKRASIQYLYQANNGRHLQRVNLLAFYQNSFTTQHSQLSSCPLSTSDAADEGAS